MSGCIRARDARHWPHAKQSVGWCASFGGRTHRVPRRCLLKMGGSASVQVGCERIDLHARPRGHRQTEKKAGQLKNDVDSCATKKRRRFDTFTCRMGVHSTVYVLRLPVVDGFLFINVVVAVDTLILAALDSKNSACRRVNLRADRAASKAWCQSHERITVL
jgi:hypothetical protein